MSAHVVAGVALTNVGHATLTQTDATNANPHATPAAPASARRKPTTPAFNPPGLRPAAPGPAYEPEPTIEGRVAFKFKTAAVLLDMSHDEITLLIQRGVLEAVVLDDDGSKARPLRRITARSILALLNKNRKGAVAAAPRKEK